MTLQMAFRKTLAVTDEPTLSKALEEELRTFVAVMDVRRLTRCGGHASDPELQSFEQAVIGEQGEVNVEITILFNDGAALDCSGQCGGEVVQRTEKLLITIDRQTGKARWETTDRVISSED